MLSHLWLIQLCIVAVLSASEREEFAEKCPMVKNLPPSVREQCIESQIVMRDCEKKKYGENCAELIKQCVTITGAPPVTIGGSGQYRMASSLRDCIKKGGYMGYCSNFTTHENCIKWKDECAPSEAAEKKDENSLEVFPETFSQCFKSQVVMQQCMNEGEEECSKIEKECVDALGTPPVTTAANGAYQMAAPLHSCIENGGWMKMCSTWINATICERWKQGCSGDKDAELPPNFSQCIQSQTVMLQCKSEFGDKCNALQEECVAATGAPPAYVDANQSYQLAQSLRRCIERGGVMNGCSNRRNCIRWRDECASALNVTVKKNSGNGDDPLTPQMARCIAGQDKMTRCNKRLGDEKCQEILKECKQKELPFRKELPPPLYTLTSKMINCVTRKMVEVL